MVKAAVDEEEEDRAAAEAVAREAVVMVNL